MKSKSEQNKAIVRRFNKEVIEDGNVESFNELVDENFISHSSIHATVIEGPAGMLHTYNNVLRPAFSDLKVIIQDQLAEGDKVMTRKQVHGVHTGEFMGVPPTNKKKVVDVIDIVRLRNGKYIEHWSINSMPSVISQLRFERISQSLSAKRSIK